MKRLDDQDKCEILEPSEVIINLNNILISTLPYVFGTIEGYKNITPSGSIDTHILVDSGASHSIFHKNMLNNKSFLENLNIISTKISMTSASNVLDDAIIGKTDLRITFLNEQGAPISIKANAKCGNLDPCSDIQYS